MKKSRAKEEKNKIALLVGKLDEGIAEKNIGRILIKRSKKMAEETLRKHFSKRKKSVYEHLEYR